MSRLSSLVSVAAQGSDSHNAPLLFVLLCVSCVRLCLPFSFLPARCLGGKVLLPSLFPTSNLSFFLSLFHSPLTLLPTFSFAFICCLWLSSLIRNKLSCSCFAPCPCFENVTSLPVVVFYIYISHSPLNFFWHFLFFHRFSLVPCPGRHSFACCFSWFNFRSDLLTFSKFYT